MKRVDGRAATSLASGGLAELSSKRLSHGSRLRTSIVGHFEDGKSRRPQDLVDGGCLNGEFTEQAHKKHGSIKEPDEIKLPAHAKLIFITSAVTAEKREEI